MSARRPVLVAATVVALVVQALVLVGLSATPASAADPLGLQPGDLVISDPGHARLVVHPANGDPDRYITGDLTSPQGLVVTPTGDVVVIDSSSSRIVKFAADGTESVVANRSGINYLALDGDYVLYSGTGFGGIGRASLTGGGRNDTYIYNPSELNPNYSGIAVDSDGDVVGADWDDLVVRIHGTGRDFARTVVHELSHESPDTCFDPRPCNLRGVALTADDRILVADTWNDEIWESDGAGGATAFGTGLTDPDGVAVGLDGTVYATDTFNQRVVAFTPGTRTQYDVVTGLLGPTGIAVVPIPPIAVGDVVAATSTGDVVRIIGGSPVPIATGLGWIRGLGVNQDGDVVVATADGTVTRIAGDGSSRTTLASGLDPLTAMGLGPDDTVYVGTAGGDLLRVLAGGGTEDVAAYMAVTAIAVSPAGDVYASDGSQVFRATGGGATIAAAPLIQSLAWTPGGDLLVGFPDSVASVGTSTGTFSPIVPSGVAALGVALDEQGRILIADGTGEVARVPAAGGSPTSLATVAAVTAVGTYVPTPAFTDETPPTTGNVGTAYDGYTFASTNPSSLGVTFSVDSGALPPGLSLDSSTGALAGTPTDAGTYTFRVQAANPARGDATAPISIVVGKRLQTITFTSSIPPIAARVPDGTYTPTATGGGSSEPVVFSIAPASSSVCSYDSGTGVVTFLTGGACTLQADQAGDADYEAAPTKVQNLAIGLLTQSAPVYTEALPSPARVGTTYTPSATISGPGSGLPVTFGITGNLVPPSFFYYPCEYDPVTGKVTFTHVGTCRIQAVRPGDSRYNVRASTNRNITVTAGILTFATDAPAEVEVGDTYLPTTNYANFPYFDVDPSSDPGVCSMSYPDPTFEATVSFDAPGTCVIFVDTFGDADYTPSSLTKTITVRKLAQTISFTSTAPSAPVVGDDYTPTATGGASANPVSFSIASASSGVCSISAGTVAFEHVGDCVVRADQTGDSTYEAGTGSQTITVGKAAQSVSFTSSAPGGATVGDTYDPTGTATSGGSVSFSIASASSGVCSISAGTVSLEHAGDCVVRADQGGTADYLAAVTQTQTVTVGKGDQAISFTSTAPSDPAVGETYDVTATASSGGTVSFSLAAGSAAFCSLSGGTVTFEHVGTCQVDADQTGTTDYLAAPAEHQSLDIGKGTQSISFTSTAPSPALLGLGSSYGPVATGGASGNGVTFSIASASSGICALVSGSVFFTHAGDCLVQADQEGNADYLAAPTEIQTITVARSSQTIAFTSTAPTGAVVGDDYDPTATATSGGTVSFSIDPASAGVCSITSGTVSFEHAGDCVVNADQSGDDDHLAAATEDQTISVGRAAQTVSFTSTAPLGALAGDLYPVAATATSGGAVVFSVDPASASVCSVSGTTVSLQHVGSCVVRADQPGTTDYVAASTQTQTIAVGRRSGQVWFDSTAPEGPVVGETYRPQTGSLPGGNIPVAVAPASEDVCSLDDGVVTFDHVGTCTVRAVLLEGPDSTPAVAEQAIEVAPAATELALTVTGEDLTAAVTVVEPGAGQPDGEVEFTVDGELLGTAELDENDDGDLVAVLEEEVESGGLREVVATYTGSDDYEPSDDTVERGDPTITAKVTSKKPKQHGWYRTPVTVRFTCTTTTAPLVDACPVPVKITKNRDGWQSILREITAEDGGEAGVVVTGIKIDRDDPRLRVAGAKSGQTYGKWRKLRCVARDRLSGVDSCKVTTHRKGHRVVYRAVAFDRAGNRTVLHGRYFLR